MEISNELTAILDKMLKIDPESDIKSIFLADQSGIVLSRVSRSSLMLKDIDGLAKVSSKIFTEFKKMEKLQIIGNFRYVTAEFYSGKGNGRITHIPLINEYFICIIGNYCPNMGMIRLIMAKSRDELIKLLH